MNYTYFLLVIAVLEFAILLGCLIMLYKKSVHKSETITKEEAFTDDVRTALYDKFCQEWLRVFSKTEYPINLENKSEILSLLWNLSSTTIDCLMLEMNDPNLLQRHRDSVSCLTGKTDNWRNLKEFHRDPSTVPCQVIAIYDILKEADYKGEIVAFGYKIKIG